MAPGCWLNLTTFMNSEFDYIDPATQKEYTQSSSINSARNLGSTASFNSVGSLIINQDCAAGPNTCSGYSVSGNFGTSEESGGSVSSYWTNVKMGYFKSPKYPDIIFFSKMQTPGYLPEIFRNDSSNLNSLYVLSEPRFIPKEYASYWQDPGANVYFGDRGYFWNFSSFPMQALGGNIWRSPISTNGVSGSLSFNLGGYKSPTSPPTDGFAGYTIQQPVIEGRTTVTQVAYADYYPASGVDWYNYLPVGVIATEAGPGFQKTGNLPADLNVLILTTAGTDANGVQTWMERYFYGIRPNGDAFGMIGYDGYILDSSVCPSDWENDPVNYPGAVCWGQNYRQTSIQMNHLKRDSEYTTYADAKGSYTLTSRANYLNSLIAKVDQQIHNPKLVARTPNPASGVADTYRPVLRGAIAAPGAGGDYNTKSISLNETIGMEANLLVHDFYVYPAGTDSFVQSGSQCRQGYALEGSLVVPGVWSGLDRSYHAGPIWAVFCSTSPDIMYIGGNHGCAPDYVERGYFYSQFESFVRDTPTSAFYYQAPNSWINFCVKTTQAILSGDLGS